jgi:hypothetical protein
MERIHEVMEFGVQYAMYIIVQPGIILQYRIMKIRAVEIHSRVSK